MSKRNPTAAVLAPLAAEPLGDRGHGDKTWTPEPGEQGISNRVGDEEPAAETDPDSFGHGRKKVVAISDEDPIDDPDDEDGDEDEEDEDEDDFDDDAEEGDDEEDDDEDEDTDEPTAKPS